MVVLRAFNQESLTMLPIVALLARHSGWLDATWQKELGVRLCGDHYLDFTGSGLYTNSQLKAATDELAAKVIREMP